MGTSIIPLAAVGVVVIRILTGSWLAGLGVVWIPLFVTFDTIKWADTWPVAIGILLVLAIAGYWRLLDARLNELEAENLALSDRLSNLERTGPFNGTR